MKNQNNYFDKLFNLKGKVVVVTGATGQLGYELCKGFRNSGSKVFGIDKMLNNQKMLRSEDCSYFELDILKKESVSDTFSNIYDQHKSIDILINNAGVSCFEPFEERSEESFDWVMDTNLKGTFFCIQEYAKRARKKDHSGSIVNIASMYGSISPDPRIYTDCDRKNSEVYGATKAGIIQMTRYFAVHLAEMNIRVNCVSPGGLYNPDAPQGEDFVKNYSHRNPMDRMGNAEEIIGAVLYLSSNAASYTNGQNIVVDGGMTSW